MVANLAWRLFKHEARRGELTIILFAIILSVAAVLSLSLFSERLQGALVERSSQFIAADSQLGSRKPINEAWIAEAETEGLATAEQVSTRSMAFGEQQMSLVDLRAVSAQYPLKGEIQVTDKPFGSPVATDKTPQSGEIWLDSRLFQLLDVKLGDTVYIGDSEFEVARVLSEIPDQGFSVFNTDPMVLIALEDLAKTNITGPGSRVTYKAYFAGEDSLIEQYYDWLRPQLDDELHRWQRVGDDESAIGRSIARAERYFLLASLLAIVLAAVAIAVAAQRYSQRHYDPVAIFKTLGATKQMIRNVYVLQILFITVLGIVIGIIAGVIIQQVVVTALAGQVDVSLDVWHWRPVFIAVLTGSICAVLFSLYPLLRLFSVPPLRVLRRDMGAGLSSRGLQFGASGGAIFLLMWVYSRDLEISAILFGSGVLLVVALLGVTYGLIALGRRLGQGAMGSWQLAWARIRRRAMDNSVQLISFSVTIMLLLVVLVMRNDMIAQWRAQLPQDTPNYFMSNITESQKTVLAEHFEANQVTLDEFYPVVRGRFVAVNDERIKTEVTKEEDGQETEGRQGLGREANLSWSLRLQHENRIVQGQWHDDWQADANDVTEDSRPIYPVSVEEGVAGRLRINLDDLLTFNIGSEIVTTRVTSIREVNWQTMQPNFFFVLHPAAMQNFAATYITSFHLDASRKADITALMQPFAAVTLFDVDARINQVREIIDQVSLAVEFILVLVLIAGSLVLFAQVQASMDERQQELAILRTLGAKGRLIRFSVINEFLIIGTVAGLMAAMANEVSLYLLQSRIFDMQASMHWDYWIIAPLVGAMVVGILGALGCYRLLRLNTGQLLRKMV
ncbi:ABC transporter permease [Alteromonas lipolytica]|uniref:Cell division protein FtsX n=1 Tax=Alteromonas lipolytica TaxID=1856405 RepID=A0A1E8FFI4_9ALTE|nr:FtsX-like permease family protein [Alteromonas lipolytica]OFI34358.1 cell division protein FtsX [Alteromonas lipolytica]GGF82170.1 ABC transporter permease [Alteromonas lipolytica]